jgi:hypothetical protein
LLLYAGTIALVLAVAASVLVLAAKLRGDIQVPGYTPIVLVSLFFGALTSLGFGIVGQYLWLALQISRRRPSYVVRSAEDHGAKDSCVRQPLPDGRGSDSEPRP